MNDLKFHYLIPNTFHYLPHFIFSITEKVFIKIKVITKSKNSNDTQKIGENFFFNFIHSFSKLKKKKD